ncbi:MAG: hypothetical protein C5B55_04095 [Blastocatellia bacterium]|nr:MAG: hypothetical protein C5B55_04095 [Blastocatellia bacterium]
MKKHLVQLLALGIVAFALTFTIAPKSSAASSTQDHFTVPFSIPFGVPCADLPPGVTQIDGVANFFVVTTTRVDSAGVAHINMNGQADGDATDNNGVAYHFNYANHFSLDVPPGDFPIPIHMSDHFNLNGNGKDAHMRVGFVIRGTIQDANDLFPWHTTAINIRGDAFNCDPI